MAKTEEEKAVETMILRLSEENKKCAIAAAEALLHIQSNDGLDLVCHNSLVKKTGEEEAEILLAKTDCL